MRTPKGSLKTTTNANGKAGLRKPYTVPTMSHENEWNGVPADRRTPPQANHHLANAHRREPGGSMAATNIHVGVDGQHICVRACVVAWHCGHILVRI